MSNNKTILTYLLFLNIIFLKISVGDRNKKWSFGPDINKRFISCLFKLLKFISKIERIYFLFYIDFSKILDNCGKYLVYCLILVKMLNTNGPDMNHQSSLNILFIVLFLF